MKKKLAEGADFYYNEQGFIVLTDKYHLEKGFCCGYGCLNCPYDYEQVPEPKRKELLEKRKSSKEENTKNGSLDQ